MPLRYLILCPLVLLVLAGCDSAGDDVRLAIPATPEENTASFQFQGLRTDLGTGFGEDVIVEGRRLNLIRDDVPFPGAEFQIIDWTRVGSEHAFHHLVFEFIGLPAPGEYPILSEELNLGIIYYYGACQRAPDDPLGPACGITRYHPIGGTIDIHEINETGFAGEFELRLETLDGDVLRVGDGRAEVHFVEP